MSRSYSGSFSVSIVSSSVSSSNSIRSRVTGIPLINKDFVSNQSISHQMMEWKLYLLDDASTVEQVLCWVLLLTRLQLCGFFLCECWVVVLCDAALRVGMVQSGWLLMASLVLRLLWIVRRRGDNVLLSMRIKMFVGRRR